VCEIFHDFVGAVSRSAFDFAGELDCQANTIYSCAMDAALTTQQVFDFIQ